MTSTASGDATRGGWRRGWLLGAVLAACLAGAASAQAQPFVYVANNGSDSVSQYAVGVGGALSSLSPASVAAGSLPATVAVSPDGKSAYVVDNAVSGTVSQYNIDPATGALSSKAPATVATGVAPYGIAITPDGKSAYVTNEGFGNLGRTVSQYNIDPTSGALSPKDPATVGSGTNPVDVAVTPDGKSVYVTNENDNTVSQYNIDPVSGALSPKIPATVATGTGPEGVAVTPDGKSVYVTNDVSGTVSQYNIDPLTGTLSPKTPATVATDAGPVRVAVAPNTKSAYVTNDSAGTVSQYDIDPRTGALSPKTPRTVAAGPGGPTFIAVTSDGNSVYVSHGFSASDTLSQYDVGPNGALTAKTPATVMTGSFPAGIAVTPVPRAHTTATSVSCSPSTFAPGDATVCKATVTDTASGGQSTPTGTVSFTNSGTGGFLGSPCTLSGSGASASCAGIFTAFPRGGRIIAAAYGGDATHSASSGFTGATVAVPVSTNGCVVFGHGRITPANGDRASFRGLVAATPPRGAEFYRDNGPANPFRLRSTSVDGLTCSDDATKASVFGTAKVNGVGSVEYRIDVRLTAWERGQDRYRIRLSNGYDSGAPQIRQGDLDIHIRDSEHHHHDANADHYKAGAAPDGG